MTDDKCPCCGSDNIEGSRVDTPGDSTASQEEYCQNCDAEWINQYQLVDQQILQESNGVASNELL